MAQAEVFAQPPSLHPETETGESLAASLLSLSTFDQVAVLANSARLLPAQFILPEAARPSLAHDAFQPEFELPILDLAVCQGGCPQGRQTMVSWLNKVCREWGFFQVINHGLPTHLMKSMESFGRSFFQKPSASKEKAPGYKGKFEASSSECRWVEAVNLGTSPDSYNTNFIHAVWPEGNQAYSDHFEQYVSLMQGIAKTILELLIEGLGVEPSIITNLFDENSTGVRYNYYPPCPQPSLAIGLGAHTDPNALTLLYQDEVGGLQLRGYDGQWRAVKPVPDAFVVNVGDALKVWSNGVYPCAEHRAVLNSSKARLSLGFFYQPKKETTMMALEQLVDVHHPSDFKPFNYGEYIKFRSTSKDGCNALNVFAGM